MHVQCQKTDALLPPMGKYVNAEKHYVPLKPLIVPHWNQDAMVRQLKNSWRIKSLTLKLTFKKTPLWKLRKSMR